MNAKQKTKWLRSPEYLAWVRTLPCVVRGTSPSHAHHMTGYGNRGNTKVHDFWALPLNPLEHTEAPGCIHQGHETWESKFGTQWMFVARTLCNAIVSGILNFKRDKDFQDFRFKGLSHEEYCNEIANLIESGAITVNKKAALGRENVF